MIKKALVLLFCLSLASPAVAVQEFHFSDIVIQGNKRVHTADVLKAIRIKPGQAVSPADVDAAMEDVYKMGVFSDVAAEISRESGAEVLIFKVEELPLVRNVRFEGNDKISTDKLREILTFRIPGIYDHFEVAKSVDVVKALYSSEGYYAADISADSHVNKDNETLVTFRIKEGDIVRIKEIRFEGNSVFDEDDLRDAMETREKWIFSWITDRGNYNELQLNQDLERIADLYFNQGYIRVRVQKPVISLVDDDKNMLLLIEIDEGPQYKVATVDAQGELLQEKNLLLEMVEVVPGEVFSRQKLRKGIEAITDFYADQGYAYANVSPLSRADDEKLLIDVMLDIEQGPQLIVERINIAGNVKTRDKVIRREVRLMEGELFNATMLKKSKARINSLGYFEAVDVSTSEGSDQNRMNVNINVKERQTGAFSVGGGYSSNGGFLAQGSVTQENFLGKGWKLNLSGSFGQKNTTYTVGLFDPYFLDTRWALGLEVYQQDSQYNDYSRSSKGFAIKAGHPVGEYSRWLSVYRLEFKDIYDVDSRSVKADEEGKYTVSSLTNSFTYNTTNDHIDPSSGLDATASWEFAGLGGDEKFSKYGLDARYFWPWRWGTVFSVHGNLGLVHSFDGSDVSIDERYFIGGISTIRGFQSREVGPQNGNGDYTGGESVAYFNFEYIFPIYKPANLKGVTFFDVGNAWAKDDMFGSWRYSTGAGIRWLSPLGPMRFEYGFNLDPKDDESDSKFDFTIGRFF